MILTQKLTSLGFAYYDGSVAEEKLNADQKNQRIVKRPHIIEFLSYCFNFHGIVVGPLSYYQDYIYFVNGNNILKKQVIQLNFKLNRFEFFFQKQKLLTEEKC